MVVFAPQRFAFKSNSLTAFSKSCVSLCIHMFAMQCYWCTTFLGGNLCLRADCGLSQKSSACSHIIRLVSMTNCVLPYNTVCLTEQLLSLYRPQIVPRPIVCDIICPKDNLCCRHVIVSLNNLSRYNNDISSLFVRVSVITLPLVNTM